MAGSLPIGAFDARTNTRENSVSAARAAALHILLIMGPRLPLAPLYALDGF